METRDDFRTVFTGLSLLSEIQVSEVGSNGSNSFYVIFPYYIVVEKVTYVEIGEPVGVGDTGLVTSLKS